MAAPFRIVFILYPRLTQLDFTGPYEVLARLPGAEVIVASKEGGTLASELGLTFAGLTRLCRHRHVPISSAFRVGRARPTRCLIRSSWRK